VHWPSGRHRLRPNACGDGKHRHLLEEPVCRAGRRSAFARRSSMPGTSRMSPGARPTPRCAMAGHLGAVPDCCAVVSCARALGRELRLISRQRQKLVGQLAVREDRLHKVLTAAASACGVGDQRPARRVGARHGPGHRARNRPTRCSACQSATPGQS